MAWSTTAPMTTQALPHAPFHITPEQEKRIDEVVARYPTLRAACIPVLHICQESVGWVSPEVVAWVAERLQITTSQVMGVVTFYSIYQKEPVGQHVVRVCRTLMCELRGAKMLQEHLEGRLGCAPGETSSDGTWTLKKGECLAGCGYAPVVQIDGRYYENLTPEKLDEIMGKIERGEALDQSETPWTAHGTGASASVPPPGSAPSGSPAPSGSQGAS